MGKVRTEPSGKAELRRRAVDHLKTNETATGMDDSNAEPQKLLQELQIHQIELEMQNEELRRTQEELEASRERYFDLFELAPVGYCTISEKGLILEANLTAATLLGVARGALIRQPLSLFIAAEDQAIYDRCSNELFEKGAPQNCELRMVKKVGTKLWVHLTVITAQDDHGATVCRAVMSDITTQKILEETQSFLLSHNYPEEDFFASLARYLAQSLGMDYVCIDRLLGERQTARTVAIHFDGKFQDNVAYALKDTPCGDAVGRTICCFHENVRRLFPRDRIMQEMGAESYIGTTLWNSKGQPIGLIAALSRKPLVNQPLAEAILKLVAVRASNEMERSQAEEQVKDLNERLERQVAELNAINKELESFSYSVSHDLRTPLRAIDGYSRMILRQQGDQFDENTRRQFDVIRDNAKTMGQLIDDLLAFSRLGRQALSLTKLNMEALTRGVWEELKTIHPDKPMILKIDHLPPGTGDRSLIKQVLINLLSNAIKFTRVREVPLIEVVGTGGETENVYFVRDNGVGFDMRYHDKLFGVFQRLHGATDYEGTGVGLAIVQRIIQRHGGRIWAESEIDKGAAFYFSLPRSKESGR
jgi:PAS domain S-box-containing protein